MLIQIKNVDEAGRLLERVKRAYDHIDAGVPCISAELHEMSATVALLQGGQGHEQRALASLSDAYHAYVASEGMKVNAARCQDLMQELKKGTLV